MKSLTLVILSVSIIRSGCAQEKKIPQNDLIEKWSASFSLGGTISGGPSKELEKEMIATGYKSTSTCIFFCPEFSKTNTRSGDSGPSWKFSAYRTIVPILKTGVIISYNPIGHTTGYLNNAQYLKIYYSVFSLAPVVQFAVKNIFTVGVGPALHKIKNVAEKHITNNYPRNYSKFGLLCEVGLTIPAKSKIYFEMNYQYRYVGRIIMGPYELVYPSVRLRMRPVTANYNHGFLSVGMGIRL